MTPSTDAELLKGLRESFNKHSGKATFSVANGDFERLMAMAERGVRRTKNCCSPVTENPAEDATYAKIEADTRDKAPKRKYPPFETTER